MKISLRRIQPVRINTYAILILAILVYCDKDNPTDSGTNNTLLGTWLKESSEGMVTATFAENGTWNQALNGAVYLKGTFVQNETVSPATLDLVYTWCTKEEQDECPPLNQTYACFVYSIQNDTLTMVHDCDNGVDSRPTSLSPDYEQDISVRQ